MEVSPVWSPDGNRIVFRANRNEAYDLFLKPTRGLFDEELIPDSPHLKTPTDWSRDGRFILYQTTDPETLTDIWILPFEGGRRPFPLVKEDFHQRSGQFSPDGRWIAYQSNESGRFEIYVRSFPSSGRKWQVSVAGGVQPRWGHDGNELYFIASDRRLMAVRIEASPSSFVAGPPLALFHTRTSGDDGSSAMPYQYAVSPDGRFLVNTIAEEPGASPITLVLNWNPERREE